MITRSLFIIVICFIVTYNTSFAQSAKEDFFRANDFVEDGDFHKALAIYQRLVSNDPNNANLNFKVGYCYLNTAIEKVKSIPYLEFASKNITLEYNISSYNEKSAPIETLYFLGKAYHVNYRFDDAEKIFIDLKSQVSDDKNFVAKIDHELKACQLARRMIQNPVEMKVTNLGRNINSEYAEHSPVISGDESILIFTSKRKGNTGNKIMDDGQYFEDIYISSFDGKKYTKAQKISVNINSSSHEASIGLSFDGSKLFIYKDDGNDGNIYISNRNGSKWRAPEKLPEPINSKYRETHASMSFDQKEIFFTSDRKGGYGGLDIYRVRKLPNGRWSKAQNLGPKINTQYDEEGPYLHPDGTSLFFSSEGHNTMGGFDIFVSYVDDNGQWSTPENIGYPINTPDDDVYYMPSVDGRRAYYASYANNSIGNYDILKIDLSETHVRNQTVIAGIATSATGTLLDDPIITLSDNDDNIIGIYTPDQESRKFLFILPRGKSFNALFESSNSPDFEYRIHVPNYAYDQSKQVVVFNEIITTMDGKKVEIKPLADNIEPEEDVEISDSLMIDPASLETKSAGTSIDESELLSTEGLLVANELYKNDKYIEATANDKNDSINYNQTEELIEESNELSGVDESGDSNKYSLKHNNSSSKQKKIIWTILLGIVLIGSSFYAILRRRRR